MPRQSGRIGNQPHHRGRSRRAQSRWAASSIAESLPLKDKEVVITFDDGPLPPYTTRILDMLAAECVKATFFMVGRMARGYPSIVRRIYNEGHTIANHSQNHPFTFHKMTVRARRPGDRGRLRVDRGRRSATRRGRAVLPRSPACCGRTRSSATWPRSGYMTWSVDFMADDWTRISARRDRAPRAQPAGSQGQGHPAAARHPAGHRARPAGPSCDELKARGYRVVHVVPATPDRPKTVTDRRSNGRCVTSAEPQMLVDACATPSSAARDARNRCRRRPIRRVPGVTSFGAETADEACR